MGLALRDWLHVRADSQWQPNAVGFRRILIQWVDVWPRLGSAVSTIQALGLLAVAVDTLPKDYAPSLAIIPRANNWHNGAGALSSKLARNTGNRPWNANSVVGCRVELATVGSVSYALAHSVQHRVVRSLSRAGTGSNEPCSK